LCDCSSVSSRKLAVALIWRKAAIKSALIHLLANEQAAA
jgi:hypothetical protein